MALEIGIVGLPNVGKSTLFNSLTKKSVPTENYPFCTIEPSVGLVAVPDKRLAVVSKITSSAKAIPAVVKFVDIAGLVKGAAKGEGLGNQFLAQIREVDVIAHIVRVFEDDSVSHVHGVIDPLHDIDIVNAELALADLETVIKRAQKNEKEVKAGDANARLEQVLLNKISDTLKEGKKISIADFNDKEREIVNNLHLLSTKPVLYVLNKKDDTDLNSEKFAPLMSFVESSGAGWIAVNVTSQTLDVLIEKAYELLGLITFFTTKSDESRAWTVPEGTSVQEAGEVIHSDFRDKFIKAEVVPYEKLAEVGSLTKAREKGLIKTEGKKYIVRDGDVIEFKI